ncbi:putative C2 domain-containing protein [Helianthus annuus]|nr:putative C2 domain-containing protein [Helianthus annuus]
MAERSLELTIISAKDLNNVNLFGKMNVYAVVYITGAGNQDQKQKTHVDKDGDSNPTWNYPMKFKTDESAALQNRLTLVVKIKTGGMLGDKDVGEVHVPVKELLDGDYTGRRQLQFVTYQVRKPSGHPKGELSFSYKFVGKPNLEEPVMAYPAAGSEFGSVYPPLDAAPIGVALGYYPPTPTVASPGSYSYPPDEGASPSGKPNKVDKLDELVMAYPTAVGSEFNSIYPPLYVAQVGASLESYPSAPTVATQGTYPPAGGAYYPPPAGYPEPRVGYAYQQQPAYGGYPPPPAPGYNVYPPQSGYGYPLVQEPQKNKLGLGLGAGLLGGALGGLLIGDMVSDAASGGGCGGGCGGF